MRAHEIAQLPVEPSLKKFEYDPVKIFDKPDTAKLKNRKALDEAGRFLETNKFGLAVVAASTGMLLTEARSMVVRDYTTQNFKFDETRLKTVGSGKSPDADDRGKSGYLLKSAMSESGGNVSILAPAGSVSGVRK